MKQYRRVCLIWLWHGHKHPSSSGTRRTERGVLHFNFRKLFLPHPTNPGVIRVERCGPRWKPRLSPSTYLFPYRPRDMVWTDLTSKTLHANHHLPFFSSVGRGGPYFVLRLPSPVTSLSHPILSLRGGPTTRMTLNHLKELTYKIVNDIRETC